MELADRILASVAERQVIRYIVRLQPAGGVGDKVFPPTYPPPRGQEGTRYAEETRWISQGTGDPAPTNCILVDSVPSQANRLEEHALRSRAALGLPDIQVRFTGLANETPLSVMEAPHRVFDALLRDSELGAEPFRNSTIGQSLINSTTSNATALLQYAPLTLLLGGWDSRRRSGAFRLARALTSEIIAVDAHVGVTSASRMDPKEIVSKAGEGRIKEEDDQAIAFSLLPESSPKTKTRPSEIGHGNIAPSINALGGVTCRYVEQIAVISLAQLRRLSFPVDGGNTEQQNQFGRALLAALGLALLDSQYQEGYSLRSRCMLVPEDEPKVELIGPTSKDVEQLKLSRGQAIEAFKALCNRAMAAGLPVSDQVVELTASAKLEELIRESRLAVRSSEDDEE